MSDLHDARVEAARKAYQAAQDANPYDFKERMSAALAAADAVVTVEMIAKALFDVRDDEFDLDEWEDVDGSERERYICDASAVLTLLRGGEDDEAVA